MTERLGDGGRRKSQQTLIKDPKITLVGRLEDPYLNFGAGLYEQGWVRLDDKEIRERIILIRDPLTSQAERTRVKEEIRQSVLGLIPWAIDRFAPRRFSSRKEELVGELFEVMDSCINRFDPDYIGRSGGKVKLVSFVAKSLKLRLRNPTTILSCDVPFYKPYVSGELVTIERCIDRLWQRLKREPTDEELAEGLQLSGISSAETFGNIRTRLMERSFTLDEIVYGQVDPDDLWPEEIPVALEIADARESAAVDRYVQRRILLKALKGILDNAFDAVLSYRERVILRRRFGLDDDRARTLEEIGEEFGFGKEWIRHIESKALRRLRLHLKSTGYKGTKDLL